MPENQTLEVVAGNGDLCGALPLDQGGIASQHSPVLPLTDRVYKVLVGIPLKGHTPPKSYHDRMLFWRQLGYQEAFDEFHKTNPRYQFALGVIGEILTPYARKVLAESALEGGMDYLFMVDDDMLAPPDLFYRLVKHDKDIIAPLAFTRNPNHKPVAYQVYEGFDPVTRQTFYSKRFIEEYPRDTLFECDAVGFGAVLIKTDVIRKVGSSAFMGMQECGEDITFCYNAKKAGFRVWMDSSVKLGHLSDPIVVTEEYSDAWAKLTPEEREKRYGKYQRYQTEGVL